MKAKNMTLMVVAIGCGLVAAFLTARLSGGSKEETIELIVAKKELPVGTLLDEKEIDSLVGHVKFPKATVPPDVITSIEELKGKKLNRTLKAGNFFSQGDVGADGGINLPHGYSKYSVKTDLVKAGSGFLQAGDKVDVILTESTANGKAKSGIILRDMLVVAVDAAARRPEGGVAVQQVNSVSVAATPSQALILSSAEKRGEVKFLLRGARDTDITPIEVSTDIPGFDKGSIDQAKPVVPNAPKTVTVIVAKADVPVNTYITNDNFDNFFTTRDVPEDLVPSKSIKDPATLRQKYITKALETDQPLYSTMLSDDKVELGGTKVVMGDPINVEPREMLPLPRQIVEEKPLYPRKFEQIINSRGYWWIEDAPGKFRRTEADNPELKGMPLLDGSTEKQASPKREDNNASDRPV